MKCPLFLSALFTHQRYYDEGEVDCIKEECAWWDDLFKRCAMVSLKCELGYIGGMLDEMIKKMPHADQFTK